MGAARVVTVTTLSQLRKAALALPEAEESSRSDLIVFSVHGQTFATATAAGWVQLHLPDREVEAALAAHPRGERLVQDGRPTGFQIPLADINGKDLNAWVRKAASHRAPERLAAAYAAAEAGIAPPGADLPPAIGKPATRALLGAGLFTLAQIATRTEEELLALHGVGPRAVRILAEALAQQGKSFR